MEQDKYKKDGEHLSNPSRGENAPENTDSQKDVNRAENAPDSPASEEPLYVDSVGVIRDPGAGQPDGWTLGNPPPPASGANPLTPAKLIIVGILGLLGIASIMLLFIQYLGASQGVSCATKRRDIENAYFNSEQGYGVVGFTEFNDTHYADRVGSCPKGRELRYFWDEEKQCVACPVHDNPVFPITVEPADGANLRMLYQSFDIFARLTTLPPRDDEGALVWSDIWGEDEVKADFWRRYFDWIGAPKFEPEDIDGLRVFYAKGPDGGYTDEIVGVSFERGSFERVYFADATIKNASYEEFVSNGQLRKPE
ncbi:MAG TPA: hypothetical protein VN446_01695 [Candidatus Acidoferrum sp.]|nr:hypothetical protein [Candidatus Acidoferrum sp.]